MPYSVNLGDIFEDVEKDARARGIAHGYGLGMGDRPAAALWDPRASRLHREFGRLARCSQLTIAGPWATVIVDVDDLERMVNR